MITSLEEESAGLYTFFPVLFSIMITSLEEDRVGLYACPACFFFSFLFTL